MTINKLEQSLVKIYPFWLDRVVRTMKYQSLKMLKEAHINITIEQWMVLLGISNYPGCSQKDIADNTVKDTANIKRIVDQLVKKELVTKKKAADDNRKYELNITGKGQEVIDKALPLMDEIRQKGLNDISEKEFDYLMGTLKKMYYNLS